MVFTRRAWLLLAFGALIGLAGIAVPDLLWWVVPIDLLVALLFVVDALSAPNSNSFRVKRLHDHVLSLGASNRIEVVLEHDLRHPHYAILRDEPPPYTQFDRREFPLKLIPGEPVQVHYHLTPLYRGEARFEDIFLRVEGRLRLIAQTYRLPARERVPVYPNLIQMREYDLLRHRGILRQMGFRQFRIRGQGTEFESLREYSPDDEFRRIDWKATARHGKPIVRDYQVERSQNVLLLLDCGRNMLAEVEGKRKFDVVLNTALMLAHVATQMEDKVGALAFADEVDQFVVPQRGRTQMRQLVDALHAVQPRMVESDYLYATTYLARRWRKRSLMVFFTDLIDIDASRMLLQSVRTLKGHHLCVVVTVSDPKLKGWSRQTPTDADTLFRRAVATQVLTDRMSAARQLERMGVHCIDAEPDTLVANLVNYYMQVKARGGL
ncbi:MAG: DUF58 domain-containing protein [Fimbriimonadales bacterium]